MAWILFVFALICYVVLGDTYPGYPGYPIVRQYSLNFTRLWTDTTDCFNKSIIAVNGMFPGPPIAFYSGDTVNVTVYNNLEEDLAVHWHGIFQTYSTWADGPDKVTQCPIPSGGVYNYVFNVSDQDEGTHFYHSHVGAQRVEGAEGPILILNKTRAVYDDERTIIVQDWWHRQAEEILQRLINGSMIFQDREDGILINGKGPSMGQFNATNNVPTFPLEPNFNCSDLTQVGTGCDHCPIEIINVTYGQLYRFRLLNFGAYVSLNIHIENHTMIVFEADGNEIQEVELDDISLTPAQRYSVLINATQPPGDYWIVVQDDVYPSAYQIAILRYESLTPPSLRPRPPPPPRSFDIRRDGLKIQSLGPAPAPANPFNPIILVLEDYIGDREKGIPANITINNHQWQEPHVPILHDVFFRQKIPPYAPVVSKGQTVDVVLQLVTNQGLYCGSHPFHLHGHDFWVIAKGNGTFPDNTWYQPSNPVRRDTEQLLDDGSPQFTAINTTGCGWMQLRFLANNPGVWFLHCHSEWHLIQGMGTVFVEAHSEIPSPPHGTLLCGGETVPASLSRSSLFIWNPLFLLSISFVCVLWTKGR